MHLPWHPPFEQRALCNRLVFCTTSMTKRDGPAQCARLEAKEAQGSCWMLRYIADCRRGFRGSAILNEFARNNMWCTPCNPFSTCPCDVAVYLCHVALGGIQDGICIGTVSQLPQLWQAYTEACEMDCNTISCSRVSTSTGFISCDLVLWAHQSM